MIQCDIDDLDSDEDLPPFVIEDKHETRIKDEVVLIDDEVLNFETNCTGLTGTIMSMFECL